MPWKYSQNLGILWHNDVVITNIGYSGHGAGKNNSTMQTIANVGPIPQGTWSIGAPHWNPHTKAYTMNLTPAPGTNTFGRTLFRIHGDSQNHPGQASDGCIVLPIVFRQRIWNSGDHELQVIP